MIRENKRTLIISSALTLLPILAGLILWNRLPDQIPSHWGFDGKIDGYSSKYLAVFGIPVFMLAIQWICTFATSLDPKNKGQNKKAIRLVLWIIPVLSIFTACIIYASAFGKNIKLESVTPLFLGLMFIIIGNYLPKCKQNYTIGIKISWTLNDEANWNATHRFSGKLWVIGGLLLILCSFIPEKIFPYILIALILAMVIIPFIYSYLYYKRNK